MGAYTFQTFVPQARPDEPLPDLFRRAVDAAAWEYGHGGYTGTLAEKHSYVVIPVANGTSDTQGVLHGPVDLATARAYAERLIDEGDPRIDDKWGPAGAIRVKDAEHDGVLLFGWASS